MEVSIPFPLEECGITTGGTCHKGKSAGRQKRQCGPTQISFSHQCQLWNKCVCASHGAYQWKHNTRCADVFKTYLCRSCICLVCGADPDFMSPEICCIIIKESLHLYIVIHSPSFSLQTHFAF